MESVYHFDGGLHLWQVEQTGTDLEGRGPRASGSAALMEGNSYIFVEVVRHNDSAHFVEELQYTGGLDWRSSGVQILALLTTGHTYGGYREVLHEVTRVHQTAGMVLEAGFVWVYVDGQMVYCRKDSPPAKPRLLARVHGFGHLRLIRPPPLSPCALGWCGVAGGHITLCWGDEEEPRPSPELFHGPALRFEVDQSTIITSIAYYYYYYITTFLTITTILTTSIMIASSTVVIVLIILILILILILLLIIIPLFVSRSPDAGRGAAATISSARTGWRIAWTRRVFPSATTEGRPAPLFGGIAPVETWRSSSAKSCRDSSTGATSFHSERVGPRTEVYLKSTGYWEMQLSTCSRSFEARDLRSDTHGLVSTAPIRFVLPLLS